LRRGCVLRAHVLCATLRPDTVEAHTVHPDRSVAVAVSTYTTEASLCLEGRRYVLGYRQARLEAG
jgi:hypothetical protein